MKVVSIVACGVMALLGILYLTNGDGRAAQKACVERGVAWYADAGYPSRYTKFKSNGLTVEEAAAKSCRALVTAYPAEN